MSEEELKKLLTGNAENNRQIGVAASLTTIIAILIENKIITMEEYQKRLEYTREAIIEKQIKGFSKEDKEILSFLKLLGLLGENK